MKDIGWLLLLGVGGYVLYEMFYGSSATTTATTTTAGSGQPVTTGSTSGTTNSTSGTANNQPATSGSPQANDNTNAANPTTGTVNQTTATYPTLSQVITLMQQYGQDPTNNNYDTYTYDVYYNMLAGTPLPGNLPAAAGPLEGGASALVPIGQWWSNVIVASGYGLSGLGMIAHNVNPYLQGPRVAKNQAYGANVYLNGIEKYIIQRSNG